MTVPNEQESGRVRARTNGMSYGAVFAWAMLIALITALASVFVIARPWGI